MSLNNNSNQKFIRKLVKKSIQHNPFRNRCMIASIILSTVLMILVPALNSMVFLHDYSNISKQQQAIIRNLNKEQTTAISSDKRISEFITNKQGSILTYKNNYIRINYFDKPKKEMSLYSIVEGHFPQKKEEVLIDADFAKKYNLFIDDRITLNNTENQQDTFIITGFIKFDGMESSLPMILTSKEYAEQGNFLKDRGLNLYVNTVELPGNSEDENIDQVFNLCEEKHIPDDKIEINTQYLAADLFSPDRMYFYIFVDLSLLIVGLIVIYSILYISVISRKSFFAQLITLGMSRKQILKFVRHESFVLSSVSTCIGSMISLIICFLLFKEDFSLNLILVIAAAVSAAIIFMVTIVSMKPAKIASDTSPIETCYSIEDSEHIISKTHAISPGILAKIHFYHDMKKSIFTMISITVSGIVFFVSIAYASSVSSDYYARSGFFREHEYVIQFSGTEIANDEDLIDLQKLNLYTKELENDLKSISGVRSISRIKESYVNYKYNEDDVYVEIHPISRKQYEEAKPYIQNAPSYDELIEQQGIIETSNELNKEYYGWKLKKGDNITLNFFNGNGYTRLNTKVLGYTFDEYRVKNFFMTGLLIPEEVIDTIFPNVDMTRYLLLDIDEQIYNAETDKAISNILQNHTLLTFKSWQEQQEEMSRQNNLIKAMGLSLAGFCILFSIVNVINTVFSSMISRKKELALYESIGMDTKQIKRMLTFETFYLTIPAIVLSLVIGIISGHLLITMLEKNELRNINYSLPVLWSIVYILFMVFIPIALSLYQYKKYIKEPLATRLRDEEE